MGSLTAIEKTQVIVPGFFRSRLWIGAIETATSRAFGSPLQHLNHLSSKIPNSLVHLVGHVFDPSPFGANSETVGGFKVLIDHLLRPGSL